jgi:hypothetical protein
MCFMFPCWNLTTYILFHDLPPPIKVDGEQKYEAEDILDSQVFNCQF